MVNHCMILFRFSFTYWSEKILVYFILHENEEDGLLAEFLYR